jgi:tetratricopeptide (TPR) repeat protein
MDIHRGRSRIWILLSRHSEAIADAERMVEVARAAGDRRGEGDALADLAWAHFQTLSGEHMASFERAAQEALGIAEETGDERVMARSLTELGIVDQCAGRLSDGELKLRKAVRLAGAVGLQDATPMQFLTQSANWRGEFRTAIAMSHDTERLAVELHDDFNESMTLAFRGLAHTALGEHAEALSVIQGGLQKARERNNLSNIGRLTNILGWLHQELGDFERALELDTEAVDLGKRTNPNVEISSLINLCYDHLNLGEARRALLLLEDTLGRAEKGFGPHRWRWTMHCHVYLAEALLADGQGEQALGHVGQAAALARQTGSLKYLARAHALGGDAALRASQWRQAEAELAEALRVAREIGYATGIWQAAHALSRAQARQEKVEAAVASARLAVETIDAVAARVPDPALRQTFLGWSRVQAVREDVERLRQAS